MCKDRLDSFSRQKKGGMRCEDRTRAQVRTPVTRQQKQHGSRMEGKRVKRRSSVKQAREERRGSSDRIRWPDSLSCSRCCNHSSGCDQAPGVKTVPKTSIRRVKGKVKSNHPPPAHETRKGEAPLSLSFTLRERERERGAHSDTSGAHIHALITSPSSAAADNTWKDRETRQSRYSVQASLKISLREAFEVKGNRLPHHSPHINGDHMACKGKWGT